MAYAAVTLFRESGVLQQKHTRERGLNRFYLTESEAIGHLLASLCGSLMENEGVNVLSSEAGSDRGSRR